MFTNNIDPVAFSIGPIQVRYYGIIFALGFILALFYIQHLRKTNKLPITNEEAYDLLLYIIIGVVVGSRIGEIIFWAPSYYLKNPLEIFKVWQGGMSFHGGLIGIIIATWLFTRKKEIAKKLTFSRIGDALAVPAAFALAIGRLGNFINGEIVGSLTTRSWCVVFPGYEGCRHPVQIYGFLGRTAAGAALLYMSAKKHKDGFVMLSMIFLFGIGRFFCDFLRDDTRYLGLSMGQLLSAAMVIAAGYLLFTRHKEDLKTIFKTGP